MSSFNPDKLPQTENAKLEYKASTNSLSTDMWKTVSAFANTRGGLIVLGIKEDSSGQHHRFVPTGVNDAHELIEQFWDKIKDNKFISYNPVLNDSVSVVTDRDGNSLIVISVSEAPESERPVHLHSDITQSFKRIGTSDTKLTSEEVGIIISNRRLKMDEVPLPEYDLEDIDRESVIEYQAELRKNPKYESYSNLPIEKFLPLMGAYVKRRDGSNKYALTAGGLLFFGKYASIIQAFKNYQLEYYDMGNPLANERYTDRVSTLTDMLNIWQFFRKTFPKLLASVKGAFRLDEQLKRIDIGASLEVAVREALVNSLMHANYFIGSPTIISNKLNYYEFKNPGKMLVNKTDFFTKLTSKPRNSIISSLFVFIGMGERSGTGGGLIIKSALDIKARLPELEEDETQTTLKIWKVDYADSIDGEALDGKAKSVIKALTKRPKMSKSEIMKATKLTRTETDNRLKLLVEKEIILRQGRGRGTFYVMPISPSQALAQLEQTSEDLRKMFNHMTK